MYYEAFLLIILHYSIIIIPIITYFITSSRNVKTTIIIWMLILLAINIYYKGCPFIRMERKLLNIPSWIGIHEYLRAFTPTPSKSVINLTTIAAFSVLMLLFLINY
jgi:hypothetical protein